MTKYIKWRKPRGGVKREDGGGRLCMHCGRDAIHTAVRKQGTFEMPVHFCDVHKTEAQDVSA